MSTKKCTQEQMASLLQWLSEECPPRRVHEVLNAGPMYSDYESERAALGYKARERFPDIEGDTIDMAVYHHLQPSKAKR